MFTMRWFPKRLVPLSDTTATVERLSKLRQSFEEAGGDPQDHMPFALLLVDVCCAIGLSEADQRKVLGPRGVRYITEWEATPVGLVKQEASALAEASAL